jgi:hypothetical protein
MYRAPRSLLTPPWRWCRQREPLDLRLRTRQPLDRKLGNRVGLRWHRLLHPLQFVYLAAALLDCVEPCLSFGRLLVLIAAQLRFQLTDTGRFEVGRMSSPDARCLVSHSQRHPDLIAAPVARARSSTGPGRLGSSSVFSPTLVTSSKHCRHQLVKGNRLVGTIRTSARDSPADRR